MCTLCDAEFEKERGALLNERELIIQQCVVLRGVRVMW
jgi:hypothetical protein